MLADRRAREHFRVLRGEPPVRRGRRGPFAPSLQPAWSRAAPTAVEFCAPRRGGCRRRRLGSRRRIPRAAGALQVSPRRDSELDRRPGAPRSLRRHRADPRHWPFRDRAPYPIGDRTRDLSSRFSPLTASASSSRTASLPHSSQLFFPSFSRFLPHLPIFHLFSDTHSLQLLHLSTLHFLPLPQPFRPRHRTMVRGRGRKG